MATPNFAAVNELAEPPLALAVSPIGIHAHHRARRKTTIQIADNEENHEVYTELSELFFEGRDGGYFWKETARWMKYEQEFDEGSSQWGHPHVSALEFSSLRVVYKAMEEGLYMLDPPAASSFAEVLQCALDEAVRTHQLALSSAVTLQEVLLKKHNHVHESTLWESIRGKRRKHKSSSVPDTRDNPLGHTAYMEEVLTIPMATVVAAKSAQNGPSPLSKSTQYWCKMATNTGTAPSCIDIPCIASMEAPGAETPNRVQQTTLAIPLGEKKSLSDSKLLQLKSSICAIPRRKQSLEDEDVDLVVAKPMSRRNPSASLLSKLSKDAEGISVMVGALDTLSAPLLVFVRLRCALVMNQTDSPLPTRFICILIGPPEGDIDYHEAGRVLATVFSNESFQCAAYNAEQGNQLVAAFSSFLSEVTALPPGDWDEDALLQFINERKEARLRKEQAQTEEEPLSSYDPPKPTFRPFVGLARDLKQLRRRYKADILSCFHWQCLLAIFFMFISCIAPVVAFGGLLQEITANRIGVSEILVASGVAGIIYGSLAVQPLVVLALTGPVLVFEEAVFHFAVQFDVDYLSWRFWIGLWTMLLLMLFAVGEMSILIKFFTRFSEEIFTLVVAGFFALQCGLQLYKVFVRNPLIPDQDCLTAHTNVSNTSSSMAHTSLGFHVFCLPNTALFSVILCIATFFVAYLMRELRHSRLLGGQIRQIVSEFGIFIAILTSVLVAFLLKSQITVETLLLGQPYLPTDTTVRVSWLVNPLGVESQLHIGAIFGAMVPALLVASLIFIEHQLTILTVTRPHFKLKRGCGYHWDLLLEGVVVGVCSMLGLPWVCGAPIRSVQHLQALSVYSRNSVPGTKPRLVKVHEQRVTNIAVHILMILSPWGSVVISHIPIPVVLGVFLYLAYISLYGVQLVHRVKLLFIPSNYHKDMPFTKSIRLWKLNVYTVTQLGLVAALWVVKFTPVAMFYPVLVILLIPVHKFIKRFTFTDTEVQLLDKEDSRITDEINGDEYDNLHVPY